MKYFCEYVKLHKKGKYGISGDYLVPELTGLIPDGVGSLLDWGCGQSNTATLIGRYKNIPIIYKYDPCISQYEKLPSGPIDFFVCTDVLEHIPEEELDETFNAIKERSPAGIFVIALKPAGQTLPNGENAHCTVMPKEWWRDRLGQWWDRVNEEKAITRSGSVVCFSVS